MRGSRYFGPAILFMGVLFATPFRAWGLEGTGRESLSEIRKEIRELEADRSRDLQLMEKLEKRVDQLEGANSQLKASNAQIKNDASQAAHQVKSLQAQVEAGPSPKTMASAVSGYLGSHTFTLTGSAGVGFIYDQQSSAYTGFPNQTQNAFFLDWEPMVLYRPNDWMLFEGVMSAVFSQSGTGVDLSTAQFFLFPHDKLTLVAGLFDQPFGNWYEDQSPMWVNRFVTAPLPYGVAPVVPPAEVGLQARGGLQWGDLGQDFDYTVWGGQGPSYTENVLGAISTSPTAAANKQTNGKSMGARIRVYPLPLDSNLGRLELGASTYNGKWLSSNWLTSWGLDFAYLNGNLQARGEWLQSYRQMPNGLPQDNRQGWYVQAGYFLNDLKVPGVPDELSRALSRLEPLIRYSGVNQHFVAIDDVKGATGIGLGGVQVGFIPDFGLNGSPALYAPHSREVALGLDYWFAPSIVWQNEFDFELPRAGGTFVNPNGTTTPVGATPNDRAFLTQFTIGF
jgi:hypothetical protein